MKKYKKYFLKFLWKKSQTENARNTIYREGLSYKNLESMKKNIYFRHDAGLLLKENFFIWTIEYSSCY